MERADILKMTSKARVRAATASGKPTTELLAKVLKGRQSSPAALDALAIDFE
jgi:hypothetical protein